MKVYKILHKPTGLYFTPFKSTGNLSTTGKIYAQRPHISYVNNGVRVTIKTWNDKKLSTRIRTLVEYFNIPKDKNGGYWIDKFFEVPNEDWEIIEFSLK